MATGRSRSGQSALDDLRAAYDEAPYESYAHPQSAPGQLAAVAWAFGLDLPDGELTGPRNRLCGCRKPDSVRGDPPLASTVGIDLSRVQIDEGQSRAQRLRAGQH